MLVDLNGGELFCSNRLRSSEAEEFHCGELQAVKLLAEVLQTKSLLRVMLLLSCLPSGTEVLSSVS